MYAHYDDLQPAQKISREPHNDRHHYIRSHNVNIILLNFIIESLF